MAARPGDWTQLSEAAEGRGRTEASWGRTHQPQILTDPGTCMKQAGWGERAEGLSGGGETVLFLRGQPLGTHRSSPHRIVGPMWPHIMIFSREDRTLDFYMSVPDIVK